MAKLTPWAVLLCKWKDQTSEPQPRTFFESLFTASGAGTRNMVEFFDLMSHGSVDLSGSPGLRMVDAADKSERVLPSNMPARRGRDRSGRFGRTRQGNRSSAKERRRPTSQAGCFLWRRGLYERSHRFIRWLASRAVRSWLVSPRRVGTGNGTRVCLRPLAPRRITRRLQRPLGRDEHLERLLHRGG